MRIKVKTSVDEYNNIHRYAYAVILDTLPILGYTYNSSSETVIGIYPAVIDCDNGDEIWKYDYYTVVTEYEDGEEKQRNEYLVAVKIEEESDD